MHGLKSGSCRFWPRTDSPPGSNMLRLACADSGSACKLAGVQIIPLPTLTNQILARTFFRSVAHLFASPAVGKFSRASSAGGRRHLQSNFAQPDRVGRRGLSEPREDFSRLPTDVTPWLYEYLYLWLESFCVLSRWKVLSGEFLRRATALVIKLRSTRSCRSPRTV